MTLYEINQELNSILEQYVAIDEERVVDGETGEVISKEEFDKMFNSLQVAREVKVKADICKIKNLRSDEEQLKIARDSYDKRIKETRNQADRLQEYLRYCLNGEKFSCTEGVVTYRTTKNCVVIDAEHLYDIPQDYIKARELKESDFSKTDIKSSLLQGIKIPGCSLENRVSMQVK